MTTVKSGVKKRKKANEMKVEEYLERDERAKRVGTNVWIFFLRAPLQLPLNLVRVMNLASTRSWLSLSWLMAQVTPPGQDVTSLSSLTASRFLDPSLFSS